MSTIFARSVHGDFEVICAECVIVSGVELVLGFCHGPLAELLISMGLSVISRKSRNSLAIAQTRRSSRGLQSLQLV